MTAFDDPAVLEVTADEASVLRVFAVAPATPEEARLANAVTAGGMALADEAGAMLGGVTLDPAWLELINRKDLETMGGIEAYLKAGYDPPDAALAVLRPALDEAPRYLLLLLTRAFEDRPTALRPVPGLTGLAAASLLRPPPVAAPMAADDIAPQPAVQPRTAARPPMSRARVSGMVALAALLVAGALVVMMVLVAG